MSIITWTDVCKQMSIIKLKLLKTTLLVLDRNTWNYTLVYNHDITVSWVWH